MRAALILSAEDFVRDMGWDSPAGVSTLPASAEQTLPFAADEKANGILTLIRQNEGVHVNQLVALAGMPVYQLLPILVQLELDHLVIALPGGKYRAVET
jgi:predicted Rossmann fold nucleotide-binding protein DprA/Smf involved in DNA uptake